MKKYSDLNTSYSKTLKAHVVWNGDGDALATFHGGYADAETYISGEEEAQEFIKRRGADEQKNTNSRRTQEENVQKEAVF